MAVEGYVDEQIQKYQKWSLKKSCEKYCHQALKPATLHCLINKEPSQGLGDLVNGNGYSVFFFYSERL